MRRQRALDLQWRLNQGYGERSRLFLFSPDRDGWAVVFEAHVCRTIAELHRALRDEGYMPDAIKDIIEGR